MRYQSLATRGIPLIQPCSVSRLDAATLAVQATIPTACHRVWSRTDFAAVGDDVWFVDPSTADATGAGASLRRIDPTTNAVAGPAVPLPFADGTLRASATALFYGEATKGQFRLRPGETAFTPVGPAAASRRRAWLSRGRRTLGRRQRRVRPVHVRGRAGRHARPAATRMGDSRSRPTQRACTSSGLRPAVAMSSGAATSMVAFRRASPSRRRRSRPALGRRRCPTSTRRSCRRSSSATRRVAKLWVAISREDPAESLLLVQGARVPKP